MGPDLARGLARDLKRLGRPDAAHELLRRAADVYPGDVWLHFDLSMACAYARPPRPVEALRHAAAAATLRPDSPAFAYLLAWAYRGASEPDLALATCWKVLDLDPADARIHLLMGQILEGKNDWAAAEAVYRQQAERVPSPLAWRSLGDMVQNQGRLHEAMPHYRRALALAPNDALSQFALGYALWRVEEPAEALPPLRAAAAGNPNHAQAVYFVGRALVDLGRYTEADPELRRVEAWPNGPATYREAAAKWRKIGVRLRETERRLPAVLAGEVQPRDVGERWDLAWVCSHQGRHIEAVRLVRTDPAVLREAPEQTPTRQRVAARWALRVAKDGGPEAAALQRDARTWLEEDLAEWEARFAANRAQHRAAAHEQMHERLADPVLAGVRAAGDEWADFWKRVRTLRDATATTLAGRPAAAPPTPSPP